MGMYTQYSFVIPLKKISKEFEDELIEDIKTFNTCSCYFAGTSNSMLKIEDDGGIVFKTIYINCDMKHDEPIEDFMIKIVPYIDHYGDLFLGYSRYEESITPELWFIDGENRITKCFNAVYEDFCKIKG